MERFEISTILFGLVNHLNRCWQNLPKLKKKLRLLELTFVHYLTFLVATWLGVVVARRGGEAGQLGSRPVPAHAAGERVRGGLSRVDGLQLLG